MARGVGIWVVRCAREQHISADLIDSCLLVNPLRGGIHVQAAGACERVLVSGPLARFADGFRVDLIEQAGAIRFGERRSSCICSPT